MKFLNKELALLLAKNFVKNSDLMVDLVATEYNWGPPVSGRVDEDFLSIWIVAKQAEGIAFLQGAKNGNWEINLPFDFIENFTVNEHIYSFFEIIINNPFHFPDEFVIRFEDIEGNKFYDNNKSKNYLITPYVGYGLNAFSFENHLIRLDQITPIHIYEKK